MTTQTCEPLAVDFIDGILMDVEVITRFSSQTRSRISA